MCDRKKGFGFSQIKKNIRYPHIGIVIINRSVKLGVVLQLMRFIIKYYNW